MPRSKYPPTIISPQCKIHQLNYGRKPAMMSGWKTWIGGFALIGLGAYLIASGDVDAGIAKIGEGVAIIGLGHKIEKSANNK